MSKHHRPERDWKGIIASGRKRAARSAPSAKAGGGKRVDSRSVPRQGGKPARPGARPGARPPRGQPGKPGRVPRPVLIKPADAAPRAPQLDGQGQPYITLVQFLKRLNLVGSGGAAKGTVRAGGVLVNGEAEVRPGRKLHAGDVVVFAGASHPVTID